MMINIGNRLECFFDDFLIDKEKTTARLTLGHPQKCENVLKLDKPWEGDFCVYFNFFFDENYPGFDGKNPNGVYRMYYLGRRSNYKFSQFKKEDVEGGVVVCYAESADGINWVRPSLGIFDWNGCTDNNIVLDKTIHPDIDNFYVFRDDNPMCPIDERYKGIAAYDEPKGPNGELNEFRLYSFLSPDGIHFRMGNMITNKGFFDSLNVTMWDGETKKYRCFARTLHKKGEAPKGASGDVGAWDKTGGAIKSETNAAGGKMPDVIRAIMTVESDDFKEWSEPHFIYYNDDEEIQMYTNNISQYFRAPHIYIGFPTRYIERKEWTENYNELGGFKVRKACVEESGYVRFGLALTDCAFMTSRDGVSFNRFPNAFLRPGAENDRNWVYGDGYMAYGIALLPPKEGETQPQFSMYCCDNHGMGVPNNLYRYSIRVDGFASYHADGEEVLVTKPFIFSGENLFVNFATSSRGGMYFTLTDEDGNSIKSCETFGDSIERRVRFDGDVSLFSGKKVILKIEMSDADIYSMQFK